MDTFCLQDWTTISCAFEVFTVTQSASGWLDLGGYEDLVFFLDVRQADTGIRLNYQTAPAAEEASFSTMLSIPPDVTVGVRSNTVLGAYSPVPVSRYVRWQLTSTGQAFAITFRIWLGASLWT
jgi:hypothetical protein